MEKYRYIIVGGGIAGGSAVKGIRQVDEDGRLALVTQEPHRPYERPPLSKKYLGGEAGLDRVYLQPEEYYVEEDVDLLLSKQVKELHPAERQITLEDRNKLGYEKLLLATGGHAWRLPLQGNDLSGVFTLRTIEDSENIRKAARRSEKALVLGGSFIGSEVAASLAQMGVRVTMIFPESRLLERIVPEEMSDFLHELYAKHQVEILPGATAERLEGGGKLERAILENGQILDLDMAVMGVGIKLNTDLAQEAGLDTRRDDRAVLVDRNLRTSDAHIYAAGDIAAWPDATFDRRLRVEHWDVARRQGLRAGRNMAGQVEAYTRLPYFFSDLFDLSFEVWGDLSNWNQTVQRGSLESRSFAYYYFYHDRLTGVLAVDRPDSERLPMQNLVKAQPAYTDVAEKLQNETLDLTGLADNFSSGGKAGAGKNGRQAKSKLSFAADIRPLFRDKDIEEMKEISKFDLSDYEDVKERAEGIYARLADGSMPCDGAWPEEKVSAFKRWMEQGMGA